MDTREIPTDVLLHDPNEEPSPEELAAQQVIELPDRDALSVVNATVALPLGAAASAGLLAGP
jgi:hypothetical protein